MFKSNIKPLTAHDLTQWLANKPETHRLFKGVYYADQIPRGNKKQSCFIANTDVSGLPGSHWVSFFFPIKGPPEYFDSGGKPPDYYHTFFEDVLVLEGPQYLYNATKVQARGSSTCGYFSIYFLYHRCRGLTMRSIVQSFYHNSLTDNDYIVLDLFKKGLKIV
jgi:hypothetical protein